LGRVPRIDGELFVQQLGTDGPMARSVTDLAWLLSVIGGYDRRAPLALVEDPLTFREPLQRDVSGTRVAWLGDWGGHLAMEPGVLECCRAALPAFESIGCVVEEAQPNFDPEALWQAWLVLRPWLSLNSLGPLYADPTKRVQMKPEAQWEVECGLRLSADDVLRASEARSAWYAAVLRLFDRFEALLMPTAQLFPFDAELRWPREIHGRPMDTYHRWMEVVIGATMAGLPAISVPAGFGATGLPMGLQIIGPPRADLDVLQLAYAYEQATQWVQRQPPPLLSSAAAHP